MKLFSPWTTCLLVLFASQGLVAEDFQPAFPMSSSEIADSQLPETNPLPQIAWEEKEKPAPPAEDRPLEVPLSPLDQLPPPAEQVGPFSTPGIESAPPEGEVPFSPEEAERLPTEYLEYQGSVMNYYPYCAPPWQAGYAHGDWTETCDCPCHVQRLRWWERVCPWNWGRASRDECRCRRHCIEASLRGMSRMSPPGMLQSTAMGIQVANGNAAQMMLHHYDFQPHDAELSVRGERELRKMARMLPASPYLIKIEATPYRPALALARQAAVVSELSTMFPGADLSGRVIISEPYSRGLDGVDAIPIHNGLLQLQSGASGTGASGRGGTPAGAGTGFGFPGAR